MDLPGRGPGRLVSEVLLFAGRNVRRFFRSRPNVISVLLFPLILLFVQLAVASKIVGAGLNTPYVDDLAPDIILITSAFGATVTALAMYNDVRSGLLERVRTLPISAMALLGGRIVGDVARVLAVAGIATAVAYAPGFRFQQGPLAALAFYGVIALFAVMATTVGLLAGLALHSADAIRTAVGNPVLLLFLLSSGFVPAGQFPSAVRPVVSANPVSTAVEALIGLSHGGPVAVPLMQTLAWVVGVTAVCLPLAVHRYRRLLG
jgi:ABC-2 type transport system permease protein